jgi:hypothetical protein
MARSNNTETEATASAFNPASMPDDTIYIAAGGYVGLLPWLNVDGLDDKMVSAVNAGRKHAAYTAAQQKVRQLEKAGLGREEIPAALNAWLAEWQPNAESDIRTLSSKRREIARERFAQFFEGRKRADLAKAIREDPTFEVKDAAGNSLFPAFMERRRAEIDAALNEWATTYTPPTTRSASGAKAAAGAVVDDLGADMFDSE